MWQNICPIFCQYSLSHGNIGPVIICPIFSQYSTNTPCIGRIFGGAFLRQTPVHSTGVMGSKAVKAQNLNPFPVFGNALPREYAGNGERRGGKGDGEKRERKLRGDSARAQAEPAARRSDSTHTHTACAASPRSLSSVPSALDPAVRTRDFRRGRECAAVTRRQAARHGTKAATQEGGRKTGNPAPSDGDDAHVAYVECDADNVWAQKENCASKRAAAAPREAAPAAEIPPGPTTCTPAPLLLCTCTYAAALTSNLSIPAGAYEWYRRRVDARIEKNG
ncbi:hypothetical protein B0H16DRAFT_1473798 [Mycena metata]|uniref:Uncharacterized protein n=1 Tax=Mycena metata TaxID=1033252 RepID=A0AAD7HK31_9AGAR|nr:hypothetical protein B0H16DRAFT_1473798 [Mycena metata]